MDYRQLYPHFERIIKAYEPRAPAPIKLYFIEQPRPGYDADITATAAFEDGAYVIECRRDYFESWPFKRAVWVLLHEVGHVLSNHLAMKDSHHGDPTPAIAAVAAQTGVTMDYARKAWAANEMRIEDEANQFADEQIKLWQPYITLIGEHHE